MHKGKMSLELKYDNHDFSGEPISEKLFVEYDGLSIDTYGDANPDSVFDYGHIPSSSVSPIVVEMEKKEESGLSGTYEIEQIETVPLDDEDDDEKKGYKTLIKMLNIVLGIKGKHR